MHCSQQVFRERESFNKLILYWERNMSSWALSQMLQWARPSKCAWSLSPLINRESLSLLKANILIWSRNCWDCCTENDMNIYRAEVSKSIRKLQLTFLCSFPILLTIFSLLEAFSYGLLHMVWGSKEYRNRRVILAVCKF